jgi:hypothetical protein
MRMDIKISQEGVPSFLFVFPLKEFKGKALPYVIDHNTIFNKIGWRKKTYRSKFMLNLTRLNRNFKQFYRKLNLGKRASS